MKTEIFIFENSEGLTARYINWRSDELQVVFRKDNRRVVFLEEASELELDENMYEKLAVVSKAQVRRQPVPIGKFGFLRLAAGPIPALQREVEPIPEDKKSLPKFMKYSAVGHVSALLLIFILSWVLNRFFAEAPAPITVQVFEQKRAFEPQKPLRLVESSKQKIRQQKREVPNAKIANRTRIAKSYARSSGGKNRRVVTRPGLGLGQKGALGVLGGYGKGFNGSGGLNLNAKSNNPGIGYGGSAARGGYERGLVGRGLVATGIGNGAGGGSLYGYGGYSTKGKGGGRPGYGSQKMGGSSGGYFEPLTEESLVEGGLDQDQINAVIQTHIGQIIYCYEQGLQSEPSLSGRVAVKFVIGAAGSVSAANVAHTSLDSRKVESCIVSKLRGWRFPRPVGNVNVRVTYPFLLKRLSQG